MAKLTEEQQAEFDAKMAELAAQPTRTLEEAEAIEREALSE